VFLVSAGKKLETGKGSGKKYYLPFIFISCHVVLLTRTKTKILQHFRFDNFEGPIKNFRNAGLFLGMDGNRKHAIFKGPSWLID